MTTTQTNVHQGKHGFYPCDRETFKKLKKLQQFYWKALHRNAQWERWSRKSVQNRVERKWYRDDKGRKTHFEVVGPLAEPQRYPIFIHAKRWRAKGEHALQDNGILEEYNKARYPAATAEQVNPLKLTIEQIDRMLADLEAFEKNA